MKTKQVIVIRRDLKMRRGKEVAQGSHASMAFLTDGARKGFLKFIFNCIKIWFHKPTREWLKTSYAKVCVRVDSESQLMEVYNKARTMGLHSNLIIDSGRTEFNGVATPTAIAIGPDDAAKIDRVTASLELY
jgi:PTH2 family peptidyl-tRNA hydrolase